MGVPLPVDWFRAGKAMHQFYQWRQQKPRYEQMNLLTGEFEAVNERSFLEWLRQNDPDTYDHFHGSADKIREAASRLVARIPGHAAVFGDSNWPDRLQRLISEDDPGPAP